MQFFKKKQADDSIAAKKNWYSDRYQTVLVQRNFFLLLTLISFVGIIVSVLAVIQVTSSKNIEPFVIEIEDKTGITNVIRPLLKEQFAYDEALRRYFITKYINARETYDPGSYRHNYNNVVRLLSASDVYTKFRRSVSPDAPGSPLRFGPKGVREVKIKSISELKAAPGQAGFVYQVRFARTDIGGTYDAVKHLVATINFDFVDMSLTTDERAINPLGFQVTGYRLDEENL